ncbi:MAG: hypothetical protein VKJ06_01500 [Vampirovibrionales bacterium]|nr:hypothetical protein [Vampirovibrionales bacterium]
MSMLLTPAVQASAAAMLSRMPGSAFRLTADQTSHVNAVPVSTMAKREGAMLGLTGVLSLGMQQVLKLPFSKLLTQSTAWKKYEPLLRVAVAMPGMLAAEWLSRKVAYGDKPVAHVIATTTRSQATLPLNRADNVQTAQAPAYRPVQPALNTTDANENPFKLTDASQPLFMAAAAATPFVLAHIARPAAIPFNPLAAADLGGPRYN